MPRALLQYVDTLYEVHKANVRTPLSQGYRMPPWRMVGATAGDGGWFLEKPGLKTAHNGRPYVHMTAVFAFAENQRNKLHVKVLVASYGFTGGSLRASSAQGIQYRTKKASDIPLALRFHRMYPPVHTCRRAQRKVLYRA